MLIYSYTLLIFYIHQQYSLQVALAHQKRMKWSYISFDQAATCYMLYHLGYRHSFKCPVLEYSMQTFGLISTLV